MAHVFISYSHVDSDFVLFLKSQLEQAGFTLWIDSERLRAGEDWRQEIDAAIRESFALVVVISPDSEASKYVTYEWSFAVGNELSVIPLLLCPLNPKEHKLHPRLEAWHYIDFTGHDHHCWNKLISRLSEVADSQGGALANRLPPSVPLPIRKAVAGLDSPNQQERLNSISALMQAKHHPQTIDAVARAVQHDFQDVRIHAALGLSRLTNGTDLRAVPGLIAALRDEFLQNEAERALVNIGNPAIPLLINALGDTADKVRLRAAAILGEIGDSAALSGMIDFVTNSELDTRWSVIMAIWQIGDPSVMPDLIRLTTDQDQFVRRAAVEGLGTLGDESVLSYLITALEDESEPVRDTAHRMLKQAKFVTQPSVKEAFVKAALRTRT